MSHSSGDLLADRRYLYGQAAAAEADHLAAVDLFEQTAALAPHWAAAWFALGESREKLGQRQAAIEAFGRAAALDKSGELGCGLRLARLGAMPTPAQAPLAYVRGLFDQYADRFDRHLVEDLAYRGPQLLVAALEAACAAAARPFAFEPVLDLGCGTGLMAKALGDRARRISGVDLSPAMAAAAERSGLYEKVEVAELGAFLHGSPAGRFDLVIAADVFVYVGDLTSTFREVARVLGQDALFAFTVQAGASEAPSLGADLRYSHSLVHIEAAAATAGLRILVSRAASTRREAGIDIAGLVMVLAAA